MEHVVGELLECKACQRKIVIERVLFGTNHTSKSIVYCWDCLPDEQKENYKKTYGWK